MRIAIVCNDTQGGVQPYVALGAGLKAAGHTVRVIAPANFEPLIRGSALDFAALSVIGDAATITAVAERGTIATMRAMILEMPRHIKTAARETLAGCEGFELITAGIGGMITALPVAERLDIPLVAAQLQPIGIRSDDFPGVLLGGVPRWLGKPGRQLSHRLTELALDLQFKPAMTSARKAVGPSPGRTRRARRNPVIYGFSKHVVPITNLAVEHNAVVGYWILPAPATWRPSPELSSFLAKPGPVVSIGFGSMGSSRPDQLARLLKTVIKSVGVRAVLQIGGAELFNEANDDIFFANDLPHDWLFPRMAAVVHHGGAGTTGAGLAAGVPSVVVPFGVDQPFWGARVAALGVGPQPIPRHRLTAETLANGISRCLADEAMRARAIALGHQIRTEDGVRAAVDIFNALAESTGR